MKKISLIMLLCCLMAISLFSAGMAEEEILFQRIPWFSGAIESLHQLSDKAGFLEDGITLTPGALSNASESFICYENDINSFIISNNPKYDDVYYSISFKGFIRKKIAGYAVKDLQMIFANDGEGLKLLTVSIEFFKAEFQDLQGKLQTVYGEGEFLQTEEGIWIAAWRGTNDTCVLLWSEDDGRSVENLIYGRTDSEQILEDCLQKIHADAEPDDTIGL